MCPSTEHKFTVCDDSKNAHGSYYHIREPAVEKMLCKFKDFAQCARSWREKSILFDAEILRPVAKTGEDGERRDDLPLESDFNGNCPKDFIDDIRKGINWKWLNSLIRAQRFGRLLSMRLVAGHRDGLTPARYILEDSIHLQVHGRRRILLISPEYSFKGMDTYP